MSGKKFSTEILFSTEIQHGSWHHLSLSSFTLARQCSEYILNVTDTVQNLFLRDMADRHFRLAILTAITTTHISFNILLLLQAHCLFHIDLVPLCRPFWLKMQHIQHRLVSQCNRHPFIKGSALIQD